MSIVEKDRLEGFTSVRGLGQRDAIWRTFGGADPNGLAIPLYVLVDKDSVIRYIGNGGDDLTNLRSAIELIHQ